MKYRQGFVASAVALLVAACGAKKQLTADEYFRQATENFRGGSYQVAAENYRDLLDQHPFSEYTEEAELRIGQAHFLEHSCPEAVAAFTDFQRRHPTSPHLPFVGYLIGKCYERQMQPPDRDQNASQNAHAFYLAVTQQYPGSPFADLARSRTEHCRESIARHELQVAEFYARRHRILAAEYRMLDIAHRFNDTDAAGNALYELGNLYRELGKDERAKLAYAAVTRHHADNGVAEAAWQALDEMQAREDIPKGDPLVILKAQTGRLRSLSLARVTDVPPLERNQSRPGPGSGFGGASSGSRMGGNPFGY